MLLGSLKMQLPLKEIAKQLSQILRADFRLVCVSSDRGTIHVYNLGNQLRARLMNPEVVRQFHWEEEQKLLKQQQEEKEQQQQQQQQQQHPLGQHAKNAFNQVQQGIAAAAESVMDSVS